MMTSYWTNKNAILRDLTVAQGREVPAEIDNLVAFDEKPPGPNYTEETEEQSYEECDVSGDSESGPDIQLIQQMLDIVREINITDIKYKVKVYEEKVVKKNELRNQFISQEPDKKLQSAELENQDKNVECLAQKVVSKPRKIRNVAMFHLIKTYGDSTNINENNFEEQNLTNIKLLKPDDFVAHAQNTSSVKSGTGKSSSLSMFKKKSFHTKKLDDMDKFQSNISSITLKSEDNNTIDEDKVVNFVPSSYAKECHKSYIERSKLQERIEENIWTKAEKQMEQIETKRELKSVGVNSTNAYSQD